MATIRDEARTLSARDREEITEAVRRFFAAGLCCAVETERAAGESKARASWEPCLLVFRSAAPSEALDAVEDIIARPSDGRVRLTAYCPSRLTPARFPASIVCSPSQATLRSRSLDAIEAVAAAGVPAPGRKEH